MAKSFGDYETAMKMRDAVRKMIAASIDTLRPLPSMAVVVSIDRVGMKAVVIKEQDTEPSTVQILSNDGPWQAGDLVVVENTLGIQRIVKTIYSAAQPGGTYIRPALIQPAHSNGATVSRQHYASDGNQVAATQAWYYGRWVSDAITAISYAEVTIWQQSPSLTLKRYRVFLTDWTSTWDAPANVESHAPSPTDYNIDLQVRGSVDPLTGFNTVEFKVVQTLALTDVPGINFDLVLYGNWTQDLTAIETIAT